MITEYIATGEPVGSRRLSRRYGLNLSPASIRNVLADLEEAGLLAQPHTSAGRVPTDAGFRVFVDALVQMREVSADDRTAIISRMKRVREASDVVREAGVLLATMSGAVSLIAPPRTSQEALAQLRFVPLDARRILAVLVTKGGTVQNRIVRLPHEVDAAELERAHNYLAGLVAERTLDEVRQALAAEMASERPMYARLSQEVVEAAIDQADGTPEVVIEGQSLLFGRPEFQSAEKIRAFLRTFEEKARLIELLDQTLVAGGVQVLIGSETQLEEVEDVSLVSASYRQPGGGTGTVGILGPTRMDYAKVVPLVEFTARAMGRALSGPLSEEDDDDTDEG